MDNYFTVCLLTLEMITGMLNKNWLRKCTIIGKKQLQKTERDHFEQCTSTKKSSTTLTVVGFTNRRTVFIAFFASSEPKRSVRRWNEIERKRIQEQQPN